jgi:hypothetical protein
VLDLVMWRDTNRRPDSCQRILTAVNTGYSRSVAIALTAAAAIALPPRRPVTTR